MNLKISYSKEADKFLKRNRDNISEDDVDSLIIMAIRKILKIEELPVDLKKLKGKYRGSFRIRKGDIRIVFSLKKEDTPVAFVQDIDFRGNVYK
jgi:mRNA-degrading endonuclease RelE of RelBE toxin-antitoxin system